MSLPPRFVALALGLAASTTLAAPALALSPAPEQELPIHVSPSSGPISGRFDVSGAGCLTEDVTGAVTIGVSADEAHGFSVVVTPGSDGSWATQISLPDDFPTGTYQVWARCWPVTPFHGEPLQYAIGTFTAIEVAAPQPLPDLRLSPTSGPAGTVVVVSGEGCVHPTATVAFSLDGDPLYADHLITDTNPDGAWSLTTTIPANARVGTYAVGAVCGPVLDEGSADYPTSTFTVTPPAAPAVPGRPNVTG